MIYLVAIFLPPLALLLYGKIFQAIFNFIICVLAIVLGILFIVLPGAPFVILWGIAVLHADAGGQLRQAGRPRPRSRRRDARAALGSIDAPDDAPEGGAHGDERERIDRASGVAGDHDCRSGLQRHRAA